MMAAVGGREKKGVGRVGSMPTPSPACGWRGKSFSRGEQLFASNRPNLKAEKGVGELSSDVGRRDDALHEPQDDVRRKRTAKAQWAIAQFSALARRIRGTGGPAHGCRRAGCCRRRLTAERKAAGAVPSTNADAKVFANSGVGVAPTTSPNASRPPSCEALTFKHGALLLAVTARTVRKWLSSYGGMGLFRLGGAARRAGGRAVAAIVTAVGSAETKMASAESGLMPTPRMPGLGAGGQFQPGQALLFARNRRT